MEIRSLLFNVLQEGLMILHWGDEGYQAYVFDTDKGTFEISVTESNSK